MSTYVLHSTGATLARTKVIPHRKGQVSQEAHAMRPVTPAQSGPRYDITDDSACITGSIR